MIKLKTTLFDGGLCDAWWPLHEGSVSGDIYQDFRGIFKFVKRSVLHCTFVNVCDCLAVRVEKCNLPSLTHWRDLYVAFSSLFPSGFIVWNCSRFRPWLRNWIQFPHSHGRGDSCQARGGEGGGKYREITIIMFFLSTQTQYPADGITKIPVFIAQELANSGIEGIFGYNRSISVCQYFNYCWASTFWFEFNSLLRKVYQSWVKVLLFMEAMKMNFNFPVPLPSAPCELSNISIVSPCSDKKSINLHSCMFRIDSAPRDKRQRFGKYKIKYHYSGTWIVPEREKYCWIIELNEIVIFHKSCC